MRANEEAARKVTQRLASAEKKRQEQQRNNKAKKMKANKEAHVRKLQVCTRSGVSTSPFSMLTPSLLIDPISLQETILQSQKAIDILNRAERKQRDAAARRILGKQGQLAKVHVFDTFEILCVFMVNIPKC